MRTGVPGALTCQEVPEARSAVSCMTSWRCGPPSVPSTAYGALNSRWMSRRSAESPLGSGRVPSRSWSASVAESRRGAGTAAGWAAPVPSGDGSAGGYRWEPCTAGTASSTRPTVSLPRLNSGRSSTLLTKTPAPSTPSEARRAQPRGRRWPSKEAPSSTR
ncbi:hypothetical protein GCM10017779_26130 [Streptomyces capillispiralis]|nr:hypothetical protein GCM10017779_26130 [Streptomyces capillispiralis]